jgi:hypothetical protein
MPRPLNRLKENTKMIKNIVWVVVCLMLTIALFACGGGGSSDPVAADTMTVTISGPSGPATTTFTEGSYSTTSSGHSFLNPNLSAYVTAINETNIELLYWDGVSLGTTVIINMRVNGNTPGLYPTGAANPATTISYDANNQSYLSFISSPSGTITLSSIGNVGDKIIGTFDAVVTLLSTTSDTLRLSGSFSVTRDN